MLPPETATVFSAFQTAFKPDGLCLSDVRPGKTQAFSLTGAHCELQCAHCGGHYLKGMKPFSACSPQTLAGKTSVLISGGSETDGRVPVARYAREILALPPEIALNVHVGFQDSRDLHFLRGRAVTVSYDLIGDEITAKEVFGLSIPAPELQNRYLDLARTFPTVPHITLGLRGGALAGEWDTLAFLARHQPAKTTLLIFRPTPHTRYEQCSPPPLAEVGKFFAQAVDRLRGPIHLGCMRPAGDYRLGSDLLAWWLGIRSIVQPHPRLKEVLIEAGVPVVVQEECCSLDAGRG